MAEFAGHRKTWARRNSGGCLLFRFYFVRREAMKSGRKFSELKTLQHPPDHPAGFKEAE
jgi:hypothetical protein